MGIRKTASAGGRSRRGFASWVLLAILAASAAARLWGITAQGFWHDELFSMELSTGRGYADYHLPRDAVIDSPPDLETLRGAPPWWKIWTNMNEDTHPPLYFMALRAWRTALGDAEAVVRGFSALWSVAAVYLVYVLGRETLGWPAGLWAAAMTALAAPQVLYGQEARDYSMVLAISLATCLALLGIERRGPSAWRLAAVGAGTCAMVLTHYFAAAAAAAMGLYALVMLRGRARAGVVAAMAAAAVVFVATWGPFMLQQRAAFADVNPMHETPGGHGIRTLLRAAVTPLQHFVGVAPAPRIEALGPGVVDAVVAVAGVLYAGALVLSIRRRHLLLWWIWAAAPIALLTVLDLTRTAGQLTLIKYTLLAAPGIFLWVAGAATPCVSRPGVILRVLPPLAGTVLCAAFLPAAYLPWRGDWAAVARFVSTHERPGDVTVIFGASYVRRTPGWIYLGVSHYLPGGRAAWPGAVVLLDGAISPEVLERVRRGGHAVLLAESADVTPSKVLPGCRVVSSEEFGNAAGAWELEWPAPEPEIAPAPK